MKSETKELLLKIGSLARRSSSPRKFIQDSLEVIAGTAPKKKIALYLAVENCITLSSSPPPTLSKGKKKFILAGTNSTQSFPSIIPFESAPHKAQNPSSENTTSLNASINGADGILIHTTSPHDKHPHSICQELLIEFLLMLEVVIERNIHTEITNFNRAALESLEAEVNGSTRKILEYLVTTGGHEGMSFFHRDFSESKETYELKAAYPNPIPEESIRYVIGDGSISATLLSTPETFVVYYDTIERSNIKDLPTPKWKDCAPDSASISVIYIPIIRKSTTIGLLRITNRRDFGGYHNAIDIRTIRALSGIFTTWYYLMEKECRTAKNLQNASHELKSTMLGIASSAQYIKNRFEAALNSSNTSRVVEINEKIQHIVTSCRSAREWISSLILSDAAHIPSALAPAPPTIQKQQKHSDFLPYAHVTKPITESYYEIARNKGIRIRFIAETALPLVKMDKPAIETAFRNIIVNAIKYTHPSKEIVIIHTFNAKREGFSRISIASESLEIGSDECARLFTRGFRSRAADASKNDGSGQGLAIARESAQSFGGDIIYNKVKLSSDPNDKELNVFSILIPPEVFIN